MKKIAFMTLGCKVNQADTASMQMLFRQAGYEVCEFTGEADVYVVNTCVVTNTGQHKSRQMIRRAVRRRNGALVVVTGCYPQTAAEEVKSIEGVDLIIGNRDRTRIVSLVEAALERKQSLKNGSDTAGLEADPEKEEVAVRPSEKDYMPGQDAKEPDDSEDSGEQKKVPEAALDFVTSDMHPGIPVVDDEVRPWEKGVRFEELSGGNEGDRTRAYLKIQEGCNQYCSYCIIPYARGPLRSRSLRNIREEVGRLTDAGYKEIVLIGIHLGCYGREMKDGTTLYDAVKAALSVPGLQRLRLGSLESVEVEDKLLGMMAKDRRLCPHLHLPLQSGCDKILKDMNRPYSTAKFKMLLEQIRKQLPEIAITTDVIVGFPGETPEDFAQTCRFVQECGFAKMHIFPYSMRKGTPAAARRDQIPEPVKKERAEKLAEIDRKMQRAYFESNIGVRHRVLAEQPVKRSGSEPDQGRLLEGLTENYIRVEFPGDESLCGSMVDIKITEAAIDNCKGVIL